MSYYVLRTWTEPVELLSTGCCDGTWLLKGDLAVLWRKKPSQVTRNVDCMQPLFF